MLGVKEAIALLDDLTGQFIALLRSKAAKFADRRRARMAVRDIGALDAVESGRMMREVGLSPSELRGAVVMPFFSEDLLTGAMCSLGISAASFRLRHGSWHNDMQRGCIRCQARKQCRRDVAGHRFARDYWRYCLNAESLSDIVACDADSERRISA